MLNNLYIVISSLSNWVDIAVLILIVYFVLTNDGFISSVADIAGLTFSFIFSFNSYSFFGRFLVNQFTAPKGLANAIGFFIAWILAEIFLFIITRILLHKIPNYIYRSKINIFLGVFPSLLQAIIFVTFITTLIVALPVRGSLKRDVLNSTSGPILISLSQNLEARIKPVFNDAIIETLNFLTIRPTSGEKVDLKFTLTKADLSQDNISEITMFNLVNQERVKKDLKPLKFDERLRAASRQYAEEMFIKGFFSHYSAVDGSSPAQRLDQKNINYLVTGENLAFAPDVQIAHTGLMNSEGHRKNILSEEFGKVGIGVVDAGIYGKMFVQEFTN